MARRRISDLPAPVAPLKDRVSMHARMLDRDLSHARQEQDLVLARPAHVVVGGEAETEDMRGEALLAVGLAEDIVACGTVVLCDIVLERGVAVDGEVGEGVDRDEAGRGDCSVRLRGHVAFTECGKNCVFCDRRERAGMGG